jgi:ATP-binding cassette subfamily B protein
MSPGTLVALFSYFQMLIWPLMGAGFMVNMIQRGAASLTRVNEVMERRPSIVSPAVPVQPRSDAVPLVEIRGLSFSYPVIKGEAGEPGQGSAETMGSLAGESGQGSAETKSDTNLGDITNSANESPAGGRKVLEDISLSIAAGTIVGILGRTGSGKSTLIKTLTRMVDPPAGTVLVKGVPVGEWDLSALRGLFGVTPQDSYLFSDSIKHNIGYGLASSTEILDGKREELLIQAAGLSTIDQDMGAFGQGWDTLIGERGLTLSGGQKQRVAISRAVIGSPEILIMDDSLSAVDAETENRVLNALLAERRGKTTIIISHRVSTLRNADLVVVLDQGRISEAGSPRELAARGGFYARMAALQQLEQADAEPPAGESPGGGGHG